MEHFIRGSCCGSKERIEGAKKTETGGLSNGWRGLGVEKPSS